MKAERISDSLAEMVESLADEMLADDDQFDYEVGVAPIAKQVDDGSLAWEMSAWVLLRLDCPETNSKSVMSAAWPLRWWGAQDFRHSLSEAMQEMRFMRLAASLTSDEDSAPG